MGISTYQSYCGAQIFDAVGLKADFIAKYFAGTHTRIEGVGLGEIAEETTRRHADAFGDAQIFKTALDVGGEYAYRTRGEDHAWTSESVATLQHAVRGNSQERYRAYAKILNEQSERLLTIRGMFRIKAPRKTSASPSRSTRSSRRRTSSSASPPARCRSARSRARRTPRSPSP